MTDYDYRDVLLKSAERVMEPGKWIQGTSFDGVETTTDAVKKDAAACALGTLAIMGYRLNNKQKVYEQAHIALYDELGTEIINWNDTPGRTAEEVAEAMRRAAE